MPRVTLSCLGVIGEDAGDGKVEHGRSLVLYIDIDHCWCSFDIIGIVVALSRVREC
jgi:hypothetical protein